MDPHLIDDELIEEIESLEADGAIVLLKWDGERQANKRTVLITRKDTDFHWRKDCSDLVETLRAAIVEYREAHTKDRG